MKMQIIVNEQAAKMIAKHQDIGQVPADELNDKSGVLQLIRDGKMQWHETFYRTRDLELSKHFTVEFDQEQQALVEKALQDAPWVEAAYAKPMDEPPM